MKSVYEHVHVLPVKNTIEHLREIGNAALLCIFTALHAMQTRSSDEISVCPSVCLSVRLSVRPSVKRVHCDKTEERYV